jgi:hypothetical protein
MVMDEKLAGECADWVAEQMTEEFGGFIAAELIDLVIAQEEKLRVEHDDPLMDHRTMSERLLAPLEAEGVPIKEGAVSRELVEEILHWEDEFRGLAGVARNVRPS